MMRAPHSYCVAVRKPNGEIVTEEAPLPRVSEKYPIFKYPVFRGVGTLGQAMWLGVKALKFSANAALDEDSAEARKESRPKIARLDDDLNLVFSFAFFIFLYKFVPLFLTTQLEKSFPVAPWPHRLQLRSTAASAWRSSWISVHDLAAGRTSAGYSSITAPSTKSSSTSNRASR